MTSPPARFSLQIFACLYPYSLLLESLLSLLCLFCLYCCFSFRPLSAIYVSFHPSKAREADSLVTTATAIELEEVDMNEFETSVGWGR